MGTGPPKSSALREQRFVLHFQPVQWATDLRVAHHEALLRMVYENDSSRPISPERFQPHAERSGMIRQIDRWCLERVSNIWRNQAPQ